MQDKKPLQIPKVGIGVMIFKDGKILLGKRKGSHGEGEFAFPGGHLEFGESFENCAKRETREETGIEIKDIKFQLVANILKYVDKHYVHLGVTAQWQSGKPKILEPDKVESWQWYAVDNLPNPLFDPCRIAVEAHLTGKNWFDSDQ